MLNQRGDKRAHRAAPDLRFYLKSHVQANLGPPVRDRNRIATPTGKPRADEGPDPIRAFEPRATLQLPLVMPILEFRQNSYTFTEFIMNRI
ncbi:hypothetical protein NL676_039706 [Syzygium grande]|nr:hypothetical protein NL676_039706 [Syzygium grande]